MKMTWKRGFEPLFDTVRGASFFFLNISTGRARRSTSMHLKWYQGHHDEVHGSFLSVWTPLADCSQLARLGDAKI